MKIDSEALALLPFEVRAEIAENVERLDFKPSEIDVIRKLCEDAIRKQAKARQGTRTDKHSGKFPESSKGETRDKIGALVGVSGKTVEKIAAIVEAAKVEPKKFGKLLADMDRTGRVNGVFRRLKNAQQAELIRAEPPPLPGNGPYRVIVADPPWPYERDDEDPSHRGALPYATDSVENICKKDVPGIAHDDCILWLWTTNHHMREAFQVLDAWGFQQKTILTWAKQHFGNGDWLRGQTEHCLVAIRGAPVVTISNQATILHAAARGHSVKPVEFYDLVESLCPAPRYADLFSRYRHNDKWDCHGNEAPAGEILRLKVLLGEYATRRQAMKRLPYIPAQIRQQRAALEAAATQLIKDAEPPRRVRKQKPKLQASGWRPLHLCDLKKAMRARGWTP